MNFPGDDHPLEVVLLAHGLQLTSFQHNPNFQDTDLSRKTLSGKLKTKASHPHIGFREVVARRNLLMALSD